jgi:5-hydroxyisourate hydrolase-like protein (transthyretin family)
LLAEGGRKMIKKLGSILLILIVMLGSVTLAAPSPAQADENTPPVANGQSVTTELNTSKAITLTATDADSDPLTYNIVDSPTHGSLEGTPPAVTYTPASGYSGSDNFTFVANDGQADSNIATVSITVNPMIDVINIPLAQGWNMISLPILPIDGSPESVLSSLTGIKYLYYYDASEPDALKRWKIYDSTVPPEYSSVDNTLTSIEPNEAYLLWVDSVQTLSFEGTILPDNIVPLYTGWNFVSFQLYSDTVENAMRQLTGFRWLYYYDSFEPNLLLRWKIWDNTIPPKYNTLTTIEPTKGYWLWVDSNQTWEEGAVDVGEVPTPSLVFTPSHIPRTFWSQNGNSKLDGQPLPVGTVITTYDPDGVLCGIYEVKVAGRFAFNCIGDNPSTPEDEGAAPGDIITFYMNGILSNVTGGSAEWQSGLQEVNIEATREYTLTVNILGSGGVTKNPDQLIYTYGTVVELTANADPGWSFDSWSDDLVSGNNLETITMDGDKTVTATFTVTPVNDPPVANDQSVSTEFNTSKAVTLTATDADSDPLTYSIGIPPTHGSLEGTPPAVTYTPEPGYSGSDNFTFVTNDGQADSNIATVFITVQPAAEATGSISGYVYESDNATPIEGATVSAYGLTKLMPLLQLWSPDGQAATDGNGHYTITGLPAGAYKVAAIAPDHERVFYDNVHNLITGALVTVSEGNDTPSINFSLGPGGTISGTVTAQDDGAPLPNVSVLTSVLIVPPNIYSTISVALTNGDGEYILDGLPYGSYLVTSPYWGGLGSGDDDYIIESWQEKAFGMAPDLVNVAAGINPTEINFTLEQGCRISGYVRQEGSGTPIAGVMVNIYDYDSIHGSWIMRGLGISGPNGYYKTFALRNGVYAARVQATGYASEWYNDIYYKDLAIAIEVTGPGTIENINFNMAPGGSISGHVQDGAGAPITNIHVYATGSTNNQWIAGVNTDAYGNYTLPALPDGSYYVKTASFVTGLSYIDEWYDNALNQNTATPVSVSAPGNTQNINFSLEIGGTISGHVFDQDSNPIIGANIQVFDYSSLMSGKWVGVGWSQTDANGYYLTSGLPAGAYVVQVSSSGYATVFYDNIFSWQSATLVAVTAGNNTPDIDFHLVPGSTITGRITDNVTGDPLAGVSVDAERIDIPIPPCWGGTSDQNGYYTISGLPLGQYKVRSPVGWGSGDNGYLMEYYDNKMGVANADIVTIPSVNPVTGIDFSLEQGTTISGHIYASSGGAIQGAWVSISVFDSQNILPGQWWAGTDQNGFYRAILPPGIYRVQAAATNRALEFYQDTYTWMESDPVDVTTGDQSGIDFTLEPGGAISGTIRDQVTNQPLANISVDCGSVDAGGGGGGALTDQNGNYTINNLPFGSYNVASPSWGRWGPGDDGYIRKNYDQNGDGNADIVTISSVTTITGIDISLEKGGIITGRVLDTATGLPISGAPVVLYKLPGPNPAFPFPFFGTVLTDSEGNYRVTDLPTGYYVVSVQASGYAWEYYQNSYNIMASHVLAINAPTDIIQGIDFSLEPGGVISGVVTSFDTGDPISGAVILASCTTPFFNIYVAFSGADGRYRLEGLSLTDYTLQVTAPGYIMQYYNHKDYMANQDIITAIADELTGINFDLQSAPSTISGYVYETDGSTTINNASVRLFVYDGSNWIQAYSLTSGFLQPPGKFFSSFLKPGEYKVKASLAGYVSEWFEESFSESGATLVTILPSAETSGINFTLDKGGIISGHVYASTNGVPIPGAHISISVYDSQNPLPAQWWADTDQNGFYQAVLPPGIYRVQAAAENWAMEFYQDAFSFLQSLPVDVTTGEKTGIDFTLEPGGVISGVVTSDMGTPISGAVILASCFSPVFNIYIAFSGADGSYRLEGLMLSDYRLQVTAPGCIMQYYNNKDFMAYQDVVTTIVGEISDINFTLKPSPGTISGYVYQADGVTPINGAFVDLYVYDGSNWIRAYSLLSGFFQPPGKFYNSFLKPGEYKVKASLPGYVSEWYQETFSESGATLVTISPSTETSGINFTLEKGGIIAGRVLDTATGLPISGAPVVVFKVSGPNLTYPFSYFGTVSTDGAGNYRMTNIPNGYYIVNVQASGYAWEFYQNTYQLVVAQVLTINAPTDIIQNINFSLEPGGVISGLITSDTGVLISGASIVAVPLDSTKGVHFIMSGADGSYRLEGLPLADYTLFVSAANYILQYYNNEDFVANADKVTTIAGEITGIDFTLKSNPGSISGYVREADGATPINGALVALDVYDGSNWILAYILISGQFQPPGKFFSNTLKPGEYKVNALLGNYVSEWFQESFSESEATLVTISSSTETSGIDFTLERVSYITGQITAGGQPLANIQVKALDAATHEFLVSTRTGANGTYNLNVPARDCIVEAVPSADGLPYKDEYFNNVYNIQDATVIAATAGSTTENIDFILESTEIITSVSPDHGIQGQTLDVVITSNNLTGVTAVKFGKGITVNSFNIDSTTQITANITIQNKATIGPRDISVIKPSGKYILPGAFTVLSGAPAVISVAPPQGIQGQSFDVIITGTNFTGVKSVIFGKGITVNSFTIDSSTQITANITIQNKAAVGPRDVSVTNLCGKGTLTGAFTVLSGVPTVISVTPSQGIQGQTLDVVITGTNFNGATAVKFGSGITINSFTIDSSTQITASITIGSKTGIGARDVSVYNLSGKGTLPGAFYVMKK